MSDITMQQN